MINEFISSLILAVIQGATEWLPISSSGHLVLFEKILGFKSGGIQFDVALHFGTLMAVFVYFGKDIVDIIEQILKGNWKSKEAKLGFLLFIASLDFKNKKKEVGFLDSVLIGFGQAVSILPGVSRSGATISTGLLRGLDEKTAVKFSFLMSIPVIF